MKRKVFSLMMTLVLAFVGIARADELTVNDGTSTNSYVPAYGFYADAYLKCEFVQPAADLADMVGATINGMTFYTSSAASDAWTSTWQVFLAEVSSTTISAFNGPGTVVYEGTLDGTGAEMAITFTTPYTYNGGNLLVGVYNITTGNYKSVTWYGVSATGASVQGYSYSSLDAVSPTQRNFLPKTTFNYGGGTPDNGLPHVLSNGVLVDAIDLGARPGYVNATVSPNWQGPAWMQPAKVQMYNDARRAYTVSVLDFTPNDSLFLLVDAELPFTLAANAADTVDLNVTLRATEAVTGTTLERQFVAIYEDSRLAAVWPITAEVYSPECPDIWELALNLHPNQMPVTNQPLYESTLTGGHLHNDYTLPFPEIEEGYDAVYKLTIENDAKLNAYVLENYANGKVALYTEDFYSGLGDDAPGHTGPMADNNYTGIQLGGGAATAPFEAQIGEGTTTTGYFPFYTLYNYSIATALYTAAELQEAGATSAPMTSLSFYATNAPGYAQQGISIWMANVTDTETSTVSPLASGMTLVYTGTMTPEIGWNEFAFNEGSFAWDGSSNVLILCQRINGSWNSTVQWQAENIPGFNGMSYLYSDYTVYDVTTTSYNMYTSNYRPNIIMTAGGRSREMVAVTINMADSWGDGWNGNYLNISATDGTEESITLENGATGSETLYITDGSHVTLTWTTGSYAYETSFTVEMNGETIFDGDYTDLPFEFDIPSAAPAPVPNPGTIDNVSFGPVIENLIMTPGNYYLVASSTDEDFEVYINVEDVPCPQVDGFVFSPMPADDEDEVDPASVTLRWAIPNYATGWRLIFGSTYHPEAGHPQTIMYPEDGSFTNEMANSYTVRNLWNNTNYFWRVEFNNTSCPGGVSSPVWGFTTHLRVPQDLTVVDEFVFDDEPIVLNWTAVVDRTYRTYNVYRDGELIGSTQTNNINATTYTDGPLPYNMNGYTYYVTAVYDEGESAPSNTVEVKVSGYSNETGINGYAYEQDGETPIPGVLVTLTGTDEFGDSHVYTATTNNNGYYSKQVYAGEYTNAVATLDGYQTTVTVHPLPFTVAYDAQVDNVNFIIDENFDPVCEVFAQYYPDSLDVNSPYVKVYWGCGFLPDAIIEDFETGDFSMFEWQVSANYPWSITTNNPYEGQYCMKSGGAGVANVVSDMIITMEIPGDGDMSFFGKISSENNWDYGYFYIDGQQMGAYTGAGNWAERTFPITAGEHTFRWSYQKDGSVNSNDDCFYVDYINFYKQPEAPIPGMTYDFDNSTMQGWTSIDADGDGYGWFVASDIMSTGYGHNGSNDCVLSQSYYMGSVLYPDNYFVSPQVQLGGMLRFYACAQDASYAAEHFGVAVSTSGNTNPSDFTMLQEWTMTAKNVPAPKKAAASPITTAAGQKGYSRDGNNRAQGEWYEFNVDLSAYSGMGYVAIRHFNCHDMFYLDVDDITIGEPSKGIAEAPTRSLNHYRVYRTNCYNDGPYTEENTVLLATVWVPDTVYIDVEWADLAPGVYKWGVGAVYAGNRGELYEAPITWTEPQAVNNHVNGDRTGATRRTVEVLPGANLNSNISALNGALRGSNAYAMALYTSGMIVPAGLINFDIDNIAGASVISTIAQVGGGAYDVNNGHLYLSDYSNGLLYEIDPTNGSLVNQVTTSYALLSICTDPTTGDIYAVDEYNYLTIVDPATGITTDVGAMDNNVASIAIAPNGTMYGLAIGSPTTLYTINTATAAQTSLGTLSVNSNYAQSIAFDVDNNKLYWAQCYDINTMNFYEINVNTLGTTQVAANTGELCGLVIPATAGPTPTPTPGTNLNQLALPRESETIWSNCLDKDMWLEGLVTVNVLLNSADNPEGATVSFRNLNEGEQELYPMQTITIDETGYYIFEDGFRKGDYEVTVEKDGYETIVDNVSIWAPTDLRYVMIEIIYGVDNLYVSSTGWAMWDAMGDPTNPDNPQGGDNTFTEGFEGGLNGWNVIDASGSEATWVHSNNNPGGYDYTTHAHGGTGFAMAYSFIDYDGAYNIDSYLVTPQKYSITANSHLNFWADNANDNYPENFSVCIATVDNPTANDFTTVWTGGAKGNGGQKANVRHDANRYDNWRSHSIDLSAYAGQNVYIAFHDVNYDAYEVWIDDVELTAGRSEGDRHLEYFKVMCESIDHEPIFNANTVHPFCQVATDELVPGEHYICKVAAVYSTGQSAWSEVEWQYIPCTEYAGTVDGVDVNGNEISWTYPGGGQGPVGDGDTFTESWDNGLNGWTNIDNDGDGHMWYHSTEAGNHSTMAVTSHSGAGHVMGESYCNATWEALHPDDYLVSPQQYAIATGSTISLWACTQDVSYPAEHFGFAISTGSNTNASDFTTIAEWTITAKGAGKGIVGRNGRNTREGNWYQFSADLSDYAGQNVWIAVRHFNCTDQFILDIDDIELSIASKGINAILGATAYACNAYGGTNPTGWITFDVDNAGAGSVLNGGLTVFGGDYCPVDHLVYATYNDNSWKAFDPTTGAIANQGMLSDFFVDCAWDYTTNTMYGTKSGNLYIWDLQASTMSLVGSMGVQSMQVIAIDLQGQMYGIEYSTGNFYRIDKTTGTTTLVGATGQGCQYVQGGGFDHNTETLYWAGYSSQGFLATVDLTTGHATVVANNVGELLSFCIPYDGGVNPNPEPGDGNVLGAMIFADGEWEAFVPYPTNNYVYEGDATDLCVRMVYDGTNTLPEGNIYYSMSCEECVEIDGACAAGLPIHAEALTETDQVKVWWGEQPFIPGEGEWYYYDNGQNEDAIGTNGGQFWWGVMFPAGSYNGNMITKVAAYDYMAMTGNVTIYNDGANAPATAVGQMNVVMTGSEDFVEYEFAEPVIIDPSKNVWVVFYNQSGATFPAAVCANTGDANGRWVSLDGSSWVDMMSEYGLSYTFMVRAYIASGRGEVSVISVDEPAGQGGTLAISGQGAKRAVRATRVSYNVYRATTATGDYSLIGTVAEDNSGYYEFIDTPETAGTYYYQVTAVYDNDCESEPAAAFDDPSVNYVSAIVTGISENKAEVALYPNPTSGNVRIEAQGMSHITVVSVLGQVMYDTDVNGNEFELNMGQYNAGVYMVRIATENGVSTQRVTVVK